MAASSSLGSASRRSAVEDAMAGRVVERVERWVEEAIMDLWERFESAWRERRREWEVWERDWGSVVVREERGRVVRRLR
jgi:hypothetical protein